MLQLSSSSAATSLREEAELLHIWIDRLPPCIEAGDVGEEAEGDDYIIDRTGDPCARPGAPGARALERGFASPGLCPGTFKVRLCNNFWILKAVVFSAASSCIEEGSQL